MNRFYKKNITKSIFLIFMLSPTFNINHTLAAEEKKKVTIDPFFNFQLWGFNQDYQGEESQVNQTLLLFRRGRFGVNTKVGNRWKMQLQMAMDGLGLTTTDSAKQSVQYRSDFSVWSVQAQYQVFENSEGLYINAGYLLPYVGRESFTIPWSVNSLDKMRSSVALRYFVTGKANGISPGVTVGGLLAQKKLFYGFTFMPNAFYMAENPQEQSPLVMGQLLFSIFGNEFDKYQYVIPQNNYKQEFGITIGVGGSYQGSSSVFNTNSTLGANVLIAWKNVELDAEYFHLFRTNNNLSHEGYTSHIRATYTLNLTKGNLLTTAAFWESNGDKDLYTTPINKENAFDTGLDFAWNNYPLMVGVHYTHSLAKNKFTYAPTIHKGAHVNAVTLKLQALLH